MTAVLPELPTTYRAAADLLVAVQVGRVSPDRLRPLVAAAAARLDVVEPTWYRRVHRETLDVRSIHRCVLAQVFGGFQAGWCRLYGDDAWDVRHVASPDCVAFLHGTPDGLWLAELDRRADVDGTATVSSASTLVAIDRPTTTEELP